MIDRLSGFLRRVADWLDGDPLPRLCPGVLIMRVEKIDEASVTLVCLGPPGMRDRTRIIAAAGGVIAYHMPCSVKPDVTGEPTVEVKKSPPGPTMTPSERTRLWREKHRDRYNEYMREYRRRKK